MREISHNITNGLRIHGQSSGDPESPHKIIALHGWLDNARTFANLAPTLAAVSHFVAMDFAGHGKSEHRPRGTRYHLVDNIDDVIQFADALGWQEFSVLGHSMGAGVASYIAAVFPERVQRLVLLEGIGSRPGAPEDGPDALRQAVNAMGRTERTPMPVYESHAEAARVRSTSNGGISIEAATLLCSRGLVAHEHGFTWSSDPRLRTVSAITMTEPLIEAFLRQIDCRTLFVGAEGGYGGSVPGLDSRLALVKNLEQVLLPGNHHFHLEPATAATVSDVVSEFMSP